MFSLTIFDDKIVATQLLRPTNLTAIQPRSAHKSLEIMMICQDLDLVSTILAVVTSVFKRLHDS